MGRTVAPGSMTSPSARAAWFGIVSQDSSIKFKNLQEGPQAPLKIARWRRLPFVTLAFLLGDDICVACGFDYTPVLFKDVGGFNWQAIGMIEVCSRPKAALTETLKSFDSARQLFKAGTEKSLAGKDGDSWHTNTITSMTAMGPTRFATSGLDGLMVMWELSRTAAY